MPETSPVFSFPHLGSQELTEEIIRRRAYELFEQRGSEHGHDFDDWLQAEAEVKGSPSSAILEQRTEPEPVLLAA